MSIKAIHVVAAVIRNLSGEVFIARRPEGVHQGGKLEFPGGKLEIGETPRECLNRELAEELGIKVTKASPLIQVRHQYSEKSILLDVWEVTEFEGQPYGAEGQETAWMKVDSLHDSDFPAANVPIIQSLKLPRLMMVTPDCLPDSSLISFSSKDYQTTLRDGVDYYLQCLEPHESGLCYLRHSGTDQRYVEDYQVIDSALRARCGRIIRQAHRRLAKDIETPYHHIRGADLFKFETRLSLEDASTAEPRLEPIYSASVHDIHEMALAVERGVDFVVLGPIQETPTHPGQSGMGWEQAKALIEAVNLPVYLIGGLSLKDLPRAKEIGAQGIAGISMFCSELGPSH